MRINKWTLCLILISGFSCRKAADITEGLTSGVLNGQAMYRILSVHHFAEQAGMKWKDNFYSAQTRIVTTDSVFYDGDGQEFEFDFGSGVWCNDGVMRKGKCRVVLDDSTLPFSGMVHWLATEKDSFFVRSKGGWEQIYGALNWHKINVDSVSLSFSINIISKNKIYVESDDPIAVRYAQPIDVYKTDQVWNGAIKSVVNQVNFNAKISSLMNDASCRSNWNQGEMELNSAADSWKINTDPFGNVNCDIVFKVSRGKGLKEDEQTFDAW